MDKTFVKQAWIKHFLRNEISLIGLILFVQTFSLVRLTRVKVRQVIRVYGRITMNDNHCSITVQLYAM